MAKPLFAAVCSHSTDLAPGEVGSHHWLPRSYRFLNRSRLNAHRMKIHRTSCTASTSLIKCIIFGSQYVCCDYGFFQHPSQQASANVHCVPLGCLGRCKSCSASAGSVVFSWRRRYTSLSHHWQPRKNQHV